METINDIVREMCKDIPRVVDAKVILRNYADRIEAAHKREVAISKTETTTATTEESSQVQPCKATTQPCKVGNAAAMREVCQKIFDILMSHGDGYTHCILTWDEFNDTQGIIRDALAKPPRNCDRFTNDAEASKAFIVWYNTAYDLNGDKWNEVSSCNLKHNIDDILHDYIEWLFAEAIGEQK